MRTLDLLVVLCSLVLVWLSFAQEGDLSLKPSFFYRIDSSTFENLRGPHLGERLPLPVVTDLDGDGKLEVVVGTREPGVVVLRPPASGMSGFEFPEVLASASLLSPVVKIRRGRQPVALQTGYLEPYSAGEVRKQVIVVVTDGWTVLCFDHQLRLLWERTVEADLSAVFLNEVAVTVTSKQMRAGDLGSVLVGGRLHARGSDDTMYTLHDQKDLTMVAFGGAPAGGEGPALRGGAGGAGDGQPAGDTPEERREMLRQHAGVVDSTFPPEGAEDSNPQAPAVRPEYFENDVINMGDPRHFSFFAFEGRAGTLRWKHDSTDFHGEVNSDDVLRLQHEHHSGEVDWRNFRYHILNSLPHHWSTRDDTEFRLARFDRRRSGQDRESHRRRKRDRGGRDVPASHKADVPAFGLNLLPHLDEEHVAAPNCVVAHLRDGIEVVHLYSGRTLCRVSLKRGAAHVDVNGDGVVDHVEAVAGINSAFARLRRTPHAPRCMSMVTSGVPPSHQLFNGSICGAAPHSFLGATVGSALRRGIALVGGANGEMEESSPVMVAQPALVQIHDREGARRRPGLGRSSAGAGSAAEPHATQVHGHQRLGRLFSSCFLINSGLVTCMSPAGRVAWRRQTPAGWSLLSGGGGGGGGRTVGPDAGAGGGVSGDATLDMRKLSMLPTLSAVRVYEHGHADHVLAVGDEFLVLLSPNGDTRAEAAVLDVPVSRPVAADFSGDGYLDVIVTTAGGYYGYVIERRVAGRLVSVLVVALVVVVVLTLVSNLAEERQQQRSRGVGAGHAAGSARIPTVAMSAWPANLSKGSKGLD